MSSNAVKKLVLSLKDRGETVATAESCTGGGILKVLTDIPGSSAVVWGGIVSYSNEAKIGLLDVSPILLEADGAVSSGVAKAMAWGIKSRSGADWTVSVTGIAGPDGGSPEKPVGTVWIAWCDNQGLTESRLFNFDGNRESIRKQTVDAALEGLQSRLDR